MVLMEIVLHYNQFLENKRQFANWIEQRIEQYGFVENQDYCSFNKIVKRETGATTCKEYALSLDMAKELSIFLWSAVQLQE